MFARRLGSHGQKTPTMQCLSLARTLGQIANAERLARSSPCNRSTVEHLPMPSVPVMMMMMVMMPMPPGPLPLTALPLAALLRIGRHAPEPMAPPSTLLTLLAAVLGASAPPTLGELPSEFLPFPTLPVRALPNTSATVIFAAEISHDNSSPVLHVALLAGGVPGRGRGRRFRGVGGEAFDEGEDVEPLFFHELVVPFGIEIGRGGVAGGIVVRIEDAEFGADLEARDEVRLLEVASEVAVLAHVCEQLQRHQHILFPRHGC